jgi:branched-subunit amino acid transport protein AzlD
MASRPCFTKGPSFFCVALVTTMGVDVVFTTTIPFVAFDNEKEQQQKVCSCHSIYLLKELLLGVLVINCELIDANVLQLHLPSTISFTASNKFLFH